MEPTLIYRVDQVFLHVLESLPVQLRIMAKGTVTSGGWSAAELVPCGKEEETGMYLFEFRAVPPKGMSIQVISPIKTAYHMEEVPDDLKGVKVIAQSNDILQKEIEDEDTGPQELSFLPQIEALYGLELKDGKLRCRVYSGGCTHKSHFYAKVDKGHLHVQPYRITFFRNIPDFCRALVPMGKELEYDLESELGIPQGAEVEVTNPFKPSYHPWIERETSEP